MSFSQSSAQSSLGLKEWVYSLSREELLSAMSFAFQSHSVASPISSPSSNNHNTVPHQQYSNHEFHLLNQMIQKQVPPPIPIYSRAIPIYPASSLGVVGREDEDHILSTRLQRPRLFQFIPQCLFSEEKAHVSDTQSSSRRRRRRQQQSGYDVPPLTHPKRRLQKQDVYYHVLARKCIAPWGDLWNIGCTEQQCKADTLLLLGTCIQYGAGGGVDNTTMQGNAVCFFHPHRSSMTTKDILTMLHVASRGQFLQDSCPAVATTTPAPQEDHIPFCAPWFHPTQDWFSLSTYMASRFEVSIRESFYKKTTFIHPEKVKDGPPPYLSSWIRNNSWMQDPQADVLIYRAYQNALIQLLKEDSSILSSGYYRDLILWKLLNTSSSSSRHHVWRRDDEKLVFLRSISSISLLYVGTPMDTFRSHVFSCLQNELSKWTERQLMESLDDETLPVLDKKKMKKSRNKKSKEKTVNKNTTSPWNKKDMTEISKVVDVQEGEKPIISSVPMTLERSKNTIMVMSILEDIIDSVLASSSDAVVDVGYSKGVCEMDSPDVDMLHVEDDITHWHTTELHISSDSTDSPLLSSDDGDMAITISQMDTQALLPLESAQPISIENIVLDSSMKTVEEDPNEEMKDLASQGRTLSKIASSTDASQAPPLTRKWLSFHDLMLHQQVPYPQEPSTTIINAIKASDDGSFYIIDDIALVTDLWWNRRPYTTRDKSMFAEFFPEDNDADDLLASSTVASLASSIFDNDSGSEHKPLSRNPIALKVQSTSSKEYELRLPPPRENLLPAFRIRGANVRARSVSSHDALDMNRSTRSFMLPAMRKRGATFVSPFSGPKARSVSSHDALDMNRSTRSFDHKRILENLRASNGASNNQLLMKEVIIDAGNIHLNFCAQSEAAINVLEESSHLNVMPKPLDQDEGYHITAFRDENSTISSVPSESPGEIISILDERNCYRDLCLTLASENAKLKNLLALATQSYQNNGNSKLLPYANFSSHHEHIRHYKLDGAMSDVGIMSEDGTTVVHESSTANSTEHVTCSGTHVTFQQNSLQGPLRHVHLNGLESRLTNEINIFLENIATQLKRLSPRRAVATTRLKRLVSLLWPRAQVKIYGSHLSNLCLPSSDMDFVICLPAVHMNASVDAAGVLEGQHSINEPHQKVLARKLRHESWIEPRSIRVIERTVVPVIKVQTKDSHTRQIQLDITFDSTEHFGLKAAELVNSLMSDLPIIRPLVLIVKQLLVDRALLTAFTGGLSSYCVFLMVTRFCQEQHASSWVDPGSLLMGFLDFFGNHFDPRTTGISVSQKKYFSRPHYSSDQQYPEYRNVIGTGVHVDTTRSALPPSYTRSKSMHHALSTGFDDMNAVYPSPTIVPVGAAQQSRPFTFDPLFVEDPLHPSNNVGRNAFRIFQVKRAFSDAHRVITANFEWDSLDNHDCEKYSILKSLLFNCNLK